MSKKLSFFLLFLDQCKNHEEEMQRPLRQLFANLGNIFVELLNLQKL